MSKNDTNDTYILHLSREVSGSYMMLTLDSYKQRTLKLAGGFESWTTRIAIDRGMASTHMCTQKWQKNREAMQALDHRTIGTLLCHCASLSAELSVVHDYTNYPKWLHVHRGWLGLMNTMFYACMRRARICSCRNQVDDPWNISSHFLIQVPARNCFSSMNSAEAVASFCPWALEFTR